MLELESEPDVGCSWDLQVGSHIQGKAMNWEDEFSPVDEQRRKEFEKEVRRNSKPQIQDYLPSPESGMYQGTLEELVLIELEYRWSKADLSYDTLDESIDPARRNAPGDSDAPPKLESYLSEFPELSGDEILPRLIEEEFLVRKRYGAAPSLAEYERRFPGIPLTETLRQNQLDEDTRRGRESGLDDQEILQIESRYDAVREYARGGMGIVYQATDTQIGREVAIKQLQTHYVDEPSAFARFTNEAKLAGKLEHPGVVPVYDLGESETGTPYYSMKLVEGKTFETLIEEVHRDFDKAGLRELLSVLISVSRTVAYAHDHQVIHRDLKPANIVVGNYGENIVLDWGLAKDLSDSDSEMSSAAPVSVELTQAGSVMGTPAYMAPEQARGEVDQINQRTDVYALGCILFHALTGQPTLTTQADFELFCEGRIAFRPLRIKPDVPRALDAVCRKAMTREQSGRYASAIAFAEELERFQADEPVAVYREPLFTRAWRWARKHRRFVTSAIVVALLVSITSVAAGFVRQAQVAQRSQQISNMQAVLDTNRETALEEISAGRFENGVSYFAKAIELCQPDPHFSSELEDLQRQREAAQNLVDFHLLIDRAELLAWDEIDQDALILVRRALALLHVFEHRDWWEHLTEFELEAQVEDELRNRVYRELCMLVAIHIKSGAFNVGAANEFLLGGNAASRAEFENAMIPLDSAKRFRRAVGLDFAEALCRQQLDPGIVNSAKLLSATSSVLDPTQTQNATDRFFIGLSLVFYDEDMAYDAEHSIVNLVNQVVSLLGANFDLKDAGTVALEHLRNGAADEPAQLWTAFTQGWTEERAGRFQAAITAFTRCIVLNPQEPRAYFHRAYEYWSLASADGQDLAQRKRYRHRAMMDLEAGKHLEQRNSDLLWRMTFVMQNTPELRDDDRAVPLAIAAAKAEAPSANFLHVQILREVRESNLSDCLTYAESVIRVQPDFGDAWLLAALLQLRLQNFDAAQSLLTRAIEKGCESATAEVVAGELALEREEWETAQQMFEKSLERSPNEYLAQRGLAMIHSGQGRHSNALQAFRSLILLAENSWEKLECLQHSSIAASHVGADDQVIADVKHIQDLRPSFTCESLMSVLKDLEKEELHARVEELLANPAPVPMRPVSRPGETVALLNGGFELPLNRYWHSDADQPLVWWNSGGCRAAALITDNTQVEGKYALQIRNLTEENAGCTGEMRQYFPAEKRIKYRLTMSVKTRDMKESGLKIQVGKSGSRELDTIIDVPAGTSDWSELEAQFEGRDTEMVLAIVSANQGTVWIDDLRIIRLPE